MIDLKDVPVDSIHKMLVHLEHERLHYEETKDDKRWDYVYGAAATVREWLSSIDKRQPGLVVVIEPPGDKA
jgi:hypothetical protein